MNGNYGYAGGKIRVIRNAAWVLFVTLLFAIPAQAQIAADPNAPAGQRPTVLTAPNGTPLINITTPSAGGVSVNQYKQLDVNANGAILNNSAGNVQTQLGGWVSGNPWLAAGSARIIVNQVNSSSPSQINGYVEVAGKRAEVVIANPSGISVNGGGFINASRVTLGTGIPQYDASGNLVSLLVQTGTVSINGAGLDLSGTDFAAIMGQAVEVNAAIWANDLKVVAGANKVGSDISGESLALSAVEGSNPAPVFILDVSALGGMYANHIFMVGTEAGFGVRNAGHISSTGKLVVTSEGRLENTGTLEAQSVQLAAASDIDNRGGTIRQNSSAALTVTAPALSNTQGGWIGAQPPATPDDGGAGSSNPSGDGAGSADSGDTSGAGSGGTGIGDITITPADPGSLTAGSAILNDGGKIYAGGPITLQTPQIDNSGGSLAVANMDVSGQSFSNAGGTLRVSQAFKADVAQFDNSGGTFQAGQSFTANVGQFINSGGTLDAGSVAVTASGNLLNDGGHINSSSDTTLNLGGTLDNSGGVIATAGDLGVRAGNVNNAGTGSLRAEGGVNLKASGAVANDGSITAGGDLNIAAGSVQSTAGGVLAAGLNADGSLGGSGNMAITTTDALAAHGTHLAAGNASLQGGSVDLSGSQTGAANITVTASSGNIVTSNATVATSGELNIRAEGANQALVNEAGALNGGQVTVVAGSLNNTQGAQIAQTGAGTATVNVSGGLNNDAGVIASNDNLAVNSGSLDNGSGSVRAENNLDLNVSGETRNEGSISAGNDLNIAANSVQSGTKSILAAGLNADGSLGASGNLSVTANNALQSQGTHLAAGNASLNGASVDLSGSQTGATNIAITAASGNVTTSHATVAASGALNIAAGNADQALVNEAGTLSGGQVAIKAGSLNNTQGAQIAQTGASTATIDVGGAVNNDAGVIVSNGSLAINTGNLDNGSGSLRAGEDVNLNASGAVSNEGNISAGNSLNIAADSVQSGANSVLAAGLNADGSLGGSGDMNLTANSTLQAHGANLAAGDARLQGGSVDLSGSRTSSGDIAITAGSGNVTTSHATVAASGALNIAAGNASQALVNEAGTLSGGQVAIKAGSLNNTQGAQIAQTGAGAATIDVGGAVNNDAGVIVSNGGLTINAGSIDNGSGSLRAGDDLNLSASGAVSNEGNVSAGNDLNIAANSVQSGAGSVLAAGLNADGSLGTGGDMSVAANNALQANGTNLAAGNATLQGSSVDLSGSQTGATNITITASGGNVTTNGAAVSAQGALNIEADSNANQALVNQAGVLSGGQVSIKAGNLSNTQGAQIAQTGTGAATIDVGGVVHNDAGVIASNGGLAINAGSIDNGSGSLRAEDDLNLNARGAVGNAGSITAGNNLSVVADSVQSSANSVLAAGLGANGRLGSGGDLSVSANDSLQAHGNNLAAGNATLQGSSVDLSGSQTGAANIAITASSGNVTTSQATVAASGALNIAAGNVGQALVNQAGTLSGGQVALKAGSLSNTQGAQIVQTGTGTATINVGGAVNNDAGVIVSNGGLAINTGSLDNGSGSLRAGDNLDLNAAGTVSNGGSITAGNDLNITANAIQSGANGVLAAGLGANGNLGASGNLNVSANDALKMQGTHLAAGSANLNGANVDLSGSQTGAANITITAASGNVTTSHATVAASGALNIAAGNADQALVNEAGTLSGGQVAIKAGSLNNTQGAQIAQTGAGTATIDVGGAVNNDAGVIVSNGSLAINTGSIDNGSGSLRAEDDLDLNASGAVNNSGSITAGKNLNIAADSVQSGAGSVLASGLNADGSLGAGGDMNVTANGTLKTGGINLAAGDARLQGANVDLSGSQTGAASATITANSGNVVTSNATVATSGALTIEAANSPNQQLVNQTGALNGGQISIRAGSIDNTRGGQIVQTGTGTGTINAGSTLNNDTGAIVSNGGLAISADNIANGSGSIGGNGAVTLQANTLSNGDGVISAADGLSITASTLAGSGSYIAGNDLSLALQGDFENDAANAFSAGRNFTFAVTGALLNSGTLSAGNNLHLSASDITNNGSISAGGLLSSRSATLTNRGTIVGGSVSLAASSKLTNTGTRALIGATDSAGILELLSPVIENRDDVTATDTTPQTTIIGMGDVVLAGGKNDDGSYRNAGSILNQSALIQSGGNMLLGSDLITNTRRVLTTTDTYTEAISADLLASLGISLSGRTGVEGVADPDSIGGVYSDPPHGGQWNSTYMYTIYQGVAASNKVTAISPESQIIAGGDLDASSSGLFQNYWSRVAAGGNIAKPVMLDQNSWQGQLAPSVRVIYTGAYHYHNYDYSIPDWTRTFCLSGCYVNYADIRYYALPSYESSFTARGTIYGGGSIDNTAGNAGLPDLGIVPGQSLAGIGGTVAKANAGNVSGNVDTVTAANAGSVPDSSNPITTVRTAKMPDGSNPVATARAVNKPDSGSTVAAAGGGNITGSPVVTATSGNLPDSSNPVIAAATAGNVLGNLTVPQGGLFSLSPDSSYLIETNPAFADYRQWLSSDYYFQLMGVDPQRMQKRLGDGFYEQQLVQSQILSLTGRAVLGGYADTQSQFTALLEAGAALAKELNLEPGLSLSATQVAALTSDVIIMQTAIVDGQEVMVPVVYLARVNQKDMSGPVIAANDINLGNAGTLTNSGIIRADNSLVVNADSINNQYGTLQSGGLMALTTAGNIDLTSSTVKAGSLYLDAGNDLLLNTAVNTANYTGPHSTVTTQRLGPQASIDVAGDALIQVGGNFEQQGANLSAGGNAVVVVGGNWNLGTVQSGEIKDIRYSDNNSHTEYLSNTGSSVNVGGNLVAQTGGNLNLTGSSISAGGSATLAAANINLNAATDVTATQSDSHSKDHAETKNIRNETLIGSAIVSGGDLTLSAQNDVNVNASALQSGATLAVAAGNDINIGAQTETHIYESTHVGTRSNVLHSSMSAEADSVHTTNSVGSTVSGNTVTLSAGNDMKVTGSDVTSQLGTTLSAGNDLTIESSTDTSQSSQFRQEKTSGLMAGGGGISIGSNQASADAATATTTNRASTVGSTEGNVTLLAGNQYTQTGSNVSAPNGDVLIAAQNIVVQESQDTHSVTFNQKQSASGLSVGSSGVSLGNAKGQGNGTQTTSTAVGSTIEGKTVTLLASGGGEDSNITIQGSHLSGTDNVAVIAENQVKVLAARDTVQTTTGEENNFSGISLKPESISLKNLAKNDLDANSNTAVVSTLTSSEGSVLIHGGGTVVLEGTQVNAKKDINIEGGDVVIAAATNTQNTDATSSSKSLGMSVVNTVYNKAAESINPKKDTEGVTSETTLTRATLNGENVNITADDTLLMSGTTINAPGATTLNADTLIMGTQTSEKISQESSQGSDTMYQKIKDEGSQDQTIEYNQINTGTLAVNANQITVEMNAKESIEALGKQPGMEWVQQLENDPVLQSRIDWQQLEEVHKNWDYSHQGLTPEGAAIVVVVVTYLTWGTASEAGAAAVNATGSTAIGSAVTAGVSSLSSMASVSLINNQGNIGKTLKDLGSSENVKNLLTAMVTAGVLSGMNLQQPGTPTAGLSTDRFMTQLKANLTASATRALISTAINGGSLEDALKSGMKNALIDTVAAQGANWIGVNTDADSFSKYAAHAIAGCAEGAARTNGSCSAGALGAALGEAAATFYNSGRTDDDLISNGPYPGTIQFAAMISSIGEAIAGGNANGISLAGSAGANAAANNYSATVWLSAFKRVVVAKGLSEALSICARSSACMLAVSAGYLLLAPSPIAVGKGESTDEIIELHPCGNSLCAITDKQIDVVSRNPNVPPQVFLKADLQDYLIIPPYNAEDANRWVAGLVGMGIPIEAVKDIFTNEFPIADSSLIDQAISNIQQNGGKNGASNGNGGAAQSNLPPDTYGTPPNGAAPPPEGDEEKKAATGVTNYNEVRQVIRANAEPYGNTSNFNVASDVELQNLYDELTKVSQPVEVPGYNGVWRELADGTRIGLRNTSKTGGRAIDVKPPIQGDQFVIHIAP